MKTLVSFCLALVWSTVLYCQAPESFNYQALLRNSDGTIKANEDITISVMIVQTSPAGTEVFTENHTASTNAFGLVNLQIGSVNTTGLASIDWSAGPYFLRIYVDGVEMGTTQLISVPYALFASEVEDKDDADADPENELQAISLVNDTLYLSIGGKVYLGHMIDNTDNQNLMMSQDTLYLSNGGEVYLGYLLDNTDDQNLSVNGYNLSIEDGNEIALPSLWSKSGNDITYNPGKVTINTQNGDVQLELADVFSAGGRNLVIGDDTYLSDIDLANTLGIYGILDPTKGAIRLGSAGPMLAGTDTNLIINKKVSLSDERITDLSDPVAEQDAVTKAYVDDLLEQVRILQYIVEGGFYVDDYDGNRYTVVKIGDQIWMAENLKTTHYSNGDTVINSYVYDDDPDNEEIYGRLYRWPSAMNGAGSSNSNPSGVQGVCPTGWHVPSDAEYMELEVYLGMSPSDTNNTDWRGTNEGGKLKATGTEYWLSPNTGATNEYGFSLLPGGSRFSGGTYNYYHIETLQWTSTASALAFYRKFAYNSAAIYRHYSSMDNSYSIRCVKD